MQISNPRPTRWATVQLVALTSIIVLLAVLLIPVVQPTGDDTVTRKMAEKIGQFHSVSHQGSGPSASVEL